MRRGGAAPAPPRPPISRVSRVWFLLRLVRHVAPQGRPTLRGLRGSATTNASTLALLAGSVKSWVFPVEMQRGCGSARSTRETSDPHRQDCGTRVAVLDRWEAQIDLWTWRSALYGAML